MKRIGVVVCVAVGMGCGVVGAQTGVSGATGASALLRGQSSASSGTREVVTEAIVNAPVSELWRVFSTGEGYTKLGVAKAEIDLRPGGLARSHYDPAGVLGDEGTIVAEIMAFEPGRMITTHIKSPPKGFPFMEAYKSVWTVVTLTDLGDGRTNVRLAMEGYGDDDESRRMQEFFRNGNAWVMKKLQGAYDAGVKTGSGAAAHTADPLAPIEVEQLVRAPREEVWKAYTTSAGWKAFFGVETKIGGGSGEPFEIYFGSEAPVGERGSEGCTILSLVPGEMFSYTWNAPPKFAAARVERTWVVVTFEEVSPAVTRVRVRHYGFAERAGAHPEMRGEWEQVRAYFAQAWPKVTGALAERFEPRKLQTE